jgi:hypothetical protein
MLNIMVWLIEFLGKIFDKLNRASDDDPRYWRSSPLGQQRQREREEQKAEKQTDK